MKLHILTGEGFTNMKILNLTTQAGLPAVNMMWGFHEKNLH